MTEEEIQKDWEDFIRNNYPPSQAELTIQFDKIDRRYDRQSNRRLQTPKQVRRSRKKRIKWRRRLGH